jgi:hypothetical protein
MNRTKMSTRKVCVPMSHLRLATARGPWLFDAVPVRACSDARGGSRPAIFRHALLSVHRHGGGQPVGGRNRFLALAQACAGKCPDCTAHPDLPCRTACTDSTLTDASAIPGTDSQRGLSPIGSISNSTLSIERPEPSRPPSRLPGSEAPGSEPHSPTRPGDTDVSLYAFASEHPSQLLTPPAEPELAATIEAHDMLIAEVTCVVHIRVCMPRIGAPARQTHLS